MRDYIEKIYNLETELIKYQITKELIDNEIENLKDESEKNSTINTSIITNEFSKKLYDLRKYNKPEPSKPQYEFFDNMKRDAIISILIMIGTFLIFIMTFHYSITNKINIILLLILLIFILIRLGKYLIYDYEKKIKERNNKKEKEYNFQKEIYEKNKIKYLEQQEPKIIELKTEYYNKLEKRETIENNIINNYDLLIKELRKIRRQETKLEISTKNKLKRLYEKNIIFPKYRNISPISSFHEYLQTGRTNTLEGSDGAYNLFELDIRSHLVYSNIKFSYEDINWSSKMYQYYLKISLKNINKYLNDKRNIIDNLITETRDKINKIKENLKYI